MSDHFDMSVRKRMAWFSAICTYLVVALHQPSFVQLRDSSTVLRLAQDFWAQGVCRIPVEAFLTLSGYLFFRGFQLSTESYAGKIGRRLKTLLLPYLLWINAGIVVELLKDPQVPTVTSVLGWLGITSQYPAIISLWYIRDLFVLCLLSPLVYILVRDRRLAYGVLFVLLAFQWVWIPWYARFTQYLLWFACGAVLAFHHPMLLRRPSTGPWRWLVLWLIGVLASQTVLSRRGLSFGIMEPVYVLTGVPVIWNLAGALDSPTLLRRVAPHTFFIYCAHGFINTLLGRLWVRVVPHTDLTLMVGFFAVPMLTVTACIIAGEGARRYVPRLYGLATGGRGLRIPRTDGAQDRSAVARLPGAHG